MLSIQAKGRVVRVCINGTEVSVRKGTPDLKVALSRLTGEFEMLRYLLPKAFDGVIVDAGGYIGAAAIALRKMYPAARVVSIEPSMTNVNILRQNVLGIPNIQVVHAALVSGDRKSVSLSDRGTGRVRIHDSQKSFRCKKSSDYAGCASGKLGGSWC